MLRRLVGDRIEDLEVIFRARPKTSGSLHYGSRLLFASDGTLFITLGERYRGLDQAQDPSDHLGTVVRLNDDGTIPADNPDPSSAVFAVGVRDGRALAFDGAACGIAQPHVWEPAPSGNLWFLLVADDGLGAESSWGLAT